jgi:hypothetical protein
MGAAERRVPGGERAAVSGRVVALFVALALLPLLVSAVQFVVDAGDDWAPTADRALIELRVRDVGRHPVQLGLYSRDGWSHPGPAAAEVLALPYRLSGSRSMGLALGALLVNGVAIAGMALVAARRGGLPLLLATVLALAVVARALGPEYLRDPWNCFLTVLPFGLLLFLVWAMASGDVWALPVGVVVATYLAQSHVQYVALGYPLLVLGAGLLTWRVVRDRAGPARRRFGIVAGLSAVLLGLLWLPAIVEQLGPGEGNLGRIAEWFAEADGGTHTLREGLRIVFGQFGLPPEWIAGHATNNAITGEPPLLLAAPPPVLLVPVVVAGLVLWRRREREALGLGLALTVALGLGVVGVARTIGLMYDYRLQWTWMLAVAAAVLVAWGAWVLVDRSPGGARVFLATGVVGVLALTGINVVQAAGADPPEPQRTPVVTGLVADVLEALPDRQGDVLLRFRDSGAQSYGLGVLLQLERRDVRAKVEDDPAHLVGDSRVHRRGAPVRATLTVATDDQLDAVLAAGGGDHLIAFSGPESPAERQRILRDTAPARRRIEAARASGELDDEAAFIALTELRQPGHGVGVFLDLPGD